MRRSASNGPSASGSRLLGSSTPTRSASSADGFGEGEPIVTHEEPEGVAAGAAAEAVEDAALGIDGEGRRLLGMERAEPLPVLAGALQVHELADELHHVQARADLIEELRAESGHHTRRGARPPSEPPPRQCAGKAGARTAWTRASDGDRASGRAPRARMSGLPQERDGGAGAAFLRGARPVIAHERMDAQHVLHGAAKRARALAMDDAHGLKPREECVVEVLFQQIARLFARSSDQVELGQDRRTLGRLDARLAELVERCPSRRIPAPAAPGAGP